PLRATRRIEAKERGRREIDRPHETTRDDGRTRVEGGRPPDPVEAPAVTGDPQRDQPVGARDVDRSAVVRRPAERTAAHRRRCELASDAAEVVRVQEIPVASLPDLEDPTARQQRGTDRAEAQLAGPE